MNAPFIDLAHPATLLLPAAIAVLIGWRLYSRVTRMVSRQRLPRVRPWLTVCLFPLLIALVMLSALPAPLSALSLVAGIVTGAVLGVYGLRLTKFEQTPLGLFYTPNVHLGIALSLLLIARIGYRAAQAYFTGEATPQSSMVFVRSPITLLILGTLAGYYVAYAVGLLRWRRRVRLESALPASGAMSSDRF